MSEKVTYEWLDTLTSVCDGLTRFIPSPDGESVLIAQIAQSDNEFYIAITHSIRHGYIESRPCSIRLRNRQHLRDIYFALFGSPLPEPSPGMAPAVLMK